MVSNKFDGAFAELDRSSEIAEKGEPGFGIYM